MTELSAMMSVGLSATLSEQMTGMKSQLSEGRDGNSREGMGERGPRYSAWLWWELSAGEDIS